MKSAPTIAFLFLSFLFLFGACANDAKAPQTKSNNTSTSKITPETQPNSPAKTNSVLKTPGEVVLAIIKNDTKSVATWLANGGDPNLKFNDGSCPLYMATGKRGDFEIVKLLVENGADINAGNAGITPLMHAAGWTKLQDVKFLLENGADKNLTDSNDKKAIDLIGDCEGCPEYNEIHTLLKD